MANMLVSKLRGRFAAYGVALSEKDLAPFMSVALTEHGMALEQKVHRLESAIKRVLDREGKYGAFDSFRGVGNDSFDFGEILAGLENPMLSWRSSLTNAYKRCFDVVHFYGSSGAWIYLLGEVSRPLDSRLPLLIDAAPGIIDFHPTSFPVDQLANVDRAILIEIVDAIERTKNEQIAKLPPEIDPFPAVISPGAVTAWGDAARVKMTSIYQSALALPPTPERMQLLQAANVVITVGLGAITWYGVVKPIFDHALEILQERRDAERRTIEARRREYERELGPMQHEIPHSSDHIDSYERNHEVIEHMV
ncbi:hypothetical protein [Burkholderia sp. Ac-20365]|uniref:hypothetical protein n=1 Tax=Burkholderia sp. Ac-20365 TaxID=2703897 RepID=UPI00197C01D0|nr:hypothetical protein [Burkholderia sp. Ac-20365]MBN3761127.1 hypothetical protein [Burkholderia sp. Ac-20365]